MICYWRGAHADLDNLDNAASAFLLNKPYVYDSNMPDALKSNMPNLAAVLDGDFIKVRPYAAHDTTHRTRTHSPPHTHTAR
jgi:predicted phage gp36 major capsid-like protein